MTFSHRLVLLSIATLGCLATGFFIGKNTQRKKDAALADAMPMNVLYIPSPKTKFHLYTLCNQPKPELDLLIDSCQKHNLDLEIVGLYRPWRGFGLRLLWLYDQIQREKLADDDVLMMVDAYDIVFLCDEQELLDKFYAFKKPLVFCAENGCFPFPERAEEYPKARSTQRFLNAGGFIGYVRAFKQAIEEVKPQVQEDDQGIWTNYFLQHQDEIAIDSECTLFLSLFQMQEGALLLENKRYRYLPTHSTPSVLHGNGNAKPLVRFYWEKLNKNN